VNNKIQGFVFIIILGFIGPYISGLDLEDYMMPDQAEALLAGEKPVLVQFNNIRPRLAPWSEALSVLLAHERQSLDPSVMVEVLYIYQKPPEAEKTAWTEEEEAGIFNHILALSSLAGIQYFSASRNEIRVFYETSSVIDAPSTKKNIPDPVYPRPPAQLTVYARQKDGTFGDNIYQYDFRYAPGKIIFSQENLTSFFYGIIPVVGKNKLRSTAAIFDAGDHILVYIASMANVASLPGMRDRIGNSFANRAEAIYKWFTGQADKSYRSVHSR
jgi:hypothetical protein